MNSYRHVRSSLTTPSRRTFVKGLAVGGAAASLGLIRHTAWAQPPGRVNPTVLSGTEFDLRIGETTVNITGKQRTALTINGSLPGPLLRWREGDTVTLRVANALDDAHVHSLARHPAAGQHGRCSGAQLLRHPSRPGYNYRFTVRQNGTYWYHSHSGFQEQQGVYGPLVIEAREPEPFKYDREHVVMLTDWTDEDAERVFRKLKKKPDYYNLDSAPLGDVLPGRQATRPARDAGRTADVGPDAHERGRPRRRHRLHLHLPDERPARRPATGRGCSRRASGCACGSSTARPCRTSMSGSPD